MVGVEDGVFPSASHQAEIFSKNLWSRCLQIYSIKCPIGKIFIRLSLLSLPLLAISRKRKINLFYQERQKFGKTKANWFQFGFSLPIINTSPQKEEEQRISLFCYLISKTISLSGKNYYFVKPPLIHDIFLCSVRPFNHTTSHNN